ncbi:MAG: hypothetical protein WDN45_14820 [Caulobacteraceae bacterium]
MKRFFLAALAATAIAGLAACATPTPYKPLNPADAAAGGYRDAKLDGNHWRVSFVGNSVTSRETVERYLLFRAAELTTTQGFDWFQETDQRTDKRADVYIDPVYGYGWRPAWRYRRPGFYGGFAGGFGGWGPGWGYGYPAARPSSASSTASTSPPPHDGPRPQAAQALDAHEVMTNLGPGIERPKA